MMRFLVLFLISLLGGAAMAQTAPDNGGSNYMTIVPQSKDYSQLFTLQAESFQPKSIAISNGDYRFDYGKDTLNSYLVEAGWALRLAEFLGGWHLEEGLGFTSFTGTANSVVQGTSGQESLRLNLLTVDSRLMYSLEWFPWKRIIPFVDGGYMYSFYSQSGNSDLEAAEGGVGNFVAGAGFRFWLNRGSVQDGNFIQRLTAVPIYLTAKVNWIYPSTAGIDLSSESYMAGVAIAL